MRPGVAILLLLATFVAGQQPAPLAAQPAPPAPIAPRTAAALEVEVNAVLNETARQWSGMLTPAGDFLNPFPADLARGHGSFVPPMLVYAIARVGERTGDAGMLRAAQRAWPRIVAPERASSFDVLAAAYAYRDLALTPPVRQRLYDYMAAYQVPIVGRRCILRPTCWGNLKLLDALTVIAIYQAGVRSPEPTGRLYDPTGPVAAATDIINRRAGEVADAGLSAAIGPQLLQGTVLSDPPADPLAYHALTTLMMRDAVARLGTGSSPAARITLRRLTDALSVLVAPDGDATYLGRGQDQVWVPAVTAAALANGARDAAATDPAAAARYLAGAERALRRLATRHAGARGLQLVPGAATRATTDGIDSYAHTVAYNGLALFALEQAREALAAIPNVPIGELPADGKLAVTDPRASALGVVGDGRSWLAIHKTATNANDLRQDFGLLALKRSTPTGWIDLIAPRPLTLTTAETAGPALYDRDRWLKPRGYRIRSGGRTVTVEGDYRRPGGRVVRSAQFRWRLTARGARLQVTGARRRDRFRMLIFTPAGTGTATPTTVTAGAATWTFDRPIRVFRRSGYASAAVERLDAIDVRLRVGRTGRFAVAIRD